EPPDAADKLVAHERVVCTPHLGASTDEAQEKVALEVAEQIVAFAERGEVKNAVNVLAVRPEVQSKVEPWLDLAGKLGSMLGQILPRGGSPASSDEVEIEVVGDVKDLAGPIVARTALAGLLRSFCDVPVNVVNASLVAEDRGMQVKTVMREKG